MIAVRGGGPGGAAFTVTDAWDRAFRNLCLADDRMEDDSARRTAAVVGVAWARVAYLMERATSPVSEEPGE